MADAVDDRIICVNKASHRYMDARYNNQRKKMHEERMRHLEAFAKKHCEIEQAKQRHLMQLHEKEVENFNLAEQADELKRRLQIEKLSKERRQYDQEYKQHEREKQQRKAEIKRFELATRLKNDKANKQFAACAKRQRDKETLKLRNILHDQRDEVLAQRQGELLRITACEEDPNLEDDVNYFEAAAQAMDNCKETGRPLYPLAKAAEIYKRENHIDMVPDGQVVRRNQIRDYCWPGYVSKAQLAFNKYEHRERCKTEENKAHHRIYENRLKIAKMAAEERPLAKCVSEYPMKLVQYRGLPAIENLPTDHNCDELQLPAGSIKLSCPTIVPVKQPVEEDPASACSFSDICKSYDKDIKSPPDQNLAESSTSIRASGGRDCSVLATSPMRSAKRPDLTRCWTAKPQAKTTAKNASVLGSIDQKYAVNQSPKTVWSKNLKQCTALL